MAFISASLASAIVLAMSGLYFSLAPSYAQNILSTNNIAIGGIISSTMVFTSVLVQYILWDRFPVRLELFGLLSVIMGLIFILLTNTYHSFALFNWCNNKWYWFWYNIYGGSKCYKHDLTRR